MAADTPKILLNLDEVQSRGYEPYTFVADGKTFTFTDPSELDWQVVESFASVEDLAEHCMSEDDRKAFYALPLPAFKLGILFEDVLKHFELGEHAAKKRRR